MEEAKPVKSKKARKSYVVLKKKPGKTSLAGASQTKGTKNKAKADTVATSTKKTTKQKDEIVKKTKRTRTGNEAEDTEKENKLKATETAKTKDPETDKNIKEARTDKKIKLDTVKLNTTAGTSKMKVQKKKSKTVKDIPKNEVKKTKMMEEVYEAITINGEPRKGATSQAIKKYIFSKRGIENEDVSHKRINNRINQILREAVENGDLARPATSKGSAPMPSANGRFMLVKKAIKSKVAKKPKTDEDGETSV